jgi:hypothetical protein
MVAPIYGFCQLILYALENEMLCKNSQALAIPQDITY